MAQKEVGIGLIGYAFMGKTHSNAYRQVGKFFDPEVKPVLARDLWTQRRKRQKSRRQLRLGILRNRLPPLDRPPRHRHYRRVIAGNEHLPMVLAAAQAGKTVFCEKPLGNSLDEAQQMLDAITQAKVVNMVCFNYRRVPAVALAKRMVEDGTLGKIYHFRARYLQDWITDPNFPLVWRLKKEVAGSGTLGDIGAHIIDLSQYLVGNLQSVCGTTETFIKQRPLQAPTTGTEGLNAQASEEMGDVTVDDAAVFVGRFANGAAGFV
jgi:predicted dehydrogenase